jgi:hypothetical protein
MLQYRFIEPFYMQKEITCYNCRHYSHCTLSSKGGLSGTCQNFSRERTATVYSHDFEDVDILKNDIWRLRNIIKTAMYREMEQGLAPYHNNSLPSTCIECLAFIAATNIFSDYLKENAQELRANSSKMNSMLRTVIIVKDNTIEVFSADNELRKLIYKKIKEDFASIKCENGNRKEEK